MSRWPRIDVKGTFGALTLMISAETGWMHLYDQDDNIVLTQEDAKVLLPHLQRFAETGKIEQQEGSKEL
jgi:hypothetical protein